eukprot:2770761-Prymnesium_polylepis.1
MTTRTVVATCAVLLLILLVATVGNPANRHLRGSDTCESLLLWIRYVQAIWQDAGMRFKIKMLVGFYQCLAAVPSVFNVIPPVGLEYLTRWIHLLELPSEVERIFWVPTACLGDYRTRIWASSTWPLAVILSSAVCLIGAELVIRRSADRTLVAARAAVTAGLQRVLPPTLGLTFLVVPSTSTRIFRAFLCETFEYNEDTSRRYLYADLTLSCDSDEYNSTEATAAAMLFLWPVGVPLLYTVLLWASRDALRT